jgi:hypothetical protein
MQTSRRLFFLIGVFILFAGESAYAAGKAFVADDGVCKRPAATQLAWLDAAEWGPFTEYIRVCSVRSGKSPVALLLISVWADLYYSDKPAGSETVAMPKPLLFNPRGRRVGELPVNFPSDPPAELVLRFTDWRKGFPHEVRLCVASPTASGDQALAPLRYQPAAQRYEQVTGEGAGPRDGACRGR